jgi:hypothetical protein
MVAAALDSLELPAHFGFHSQGDFFRSLEWFRCLSTTAVRSAPRIYDAGHAALVCYWDGSTLRSLTNYYTLEYGPLGAGDLGEIAERIAVDAPRSIHLEFLPESATRALSQALRRVGFFVRPYVMYENWHVTLQGRDFEAYLRGRPSRMINTIKRRRKKLEAAHKCAIVLCRHPDRIDDFSRVYAQSWKRPEPHPAFIPALAKTCATLGILRLGVLYVDGEAAASQLWITGGGKAVIYKLAYGERFRDFSVGSILSLALFREAIDVDRVEEIDYGVGSEPYKRDWMEAKRHRYGLVAFNLRKASGICLAGLERARMILRRLVR